MLPDSTILRKHMELINTHLKDADDEFDNSKYLGCLKIRRFKVHEPGHE